MTDIVTREEREELRRLWEGENRAAMATGDSEEWEIVARVLAGRMFLALPRLLDTIDALEAKNAVLREALEALPGAVSMAGEAGGWLWLAEWEAFEGQVATALADPAPRAADLLAVAEAAREWKRMHTGLHPQGGQTMLLMREVDQNLKAALARLDGKGE